MKVMTYGKNIDVTPALKDYAVEKVGKLGKYFDGGPQEAHVTMKVEKGRHIVEVTANTNGLILRGEEESEDMYASIDGVIEKLERQIHKYKTKLNKRFREKRQEMKEEFKEERTEELMHEIYDDVEEDEFEADIVRTKTFAVKPMDVQEAVMQMDLLGHDFFVFSNANTEEVNVVYKRKQGNYGLIEPTF
ncbi:MAG: ribosome hibernation-promoting factor, HPF/YfiA family [Bacillota bacterium]